MENEYNGTVKLPLEATEDPALSLSILLYWTTNGGVPVN